MKHDHAVVVGGSMAGLAVARVLADHYARVTVLDRDRFPESSDHRRGVPQSHHAHALLARGQLELESLFPGLESELLARGARKLEMLQAFAVSRRWGWAPRAECGRASLWCSRALLETLVRDRVRRHGRIELVPETTVDALLVDKTAEPRATGVRAVRAGEPARDVRADLVVDASGRGSKAPKWLEAVGLPRPEEDTVEAFAGYASRFYERPNESTRPKDWWWEGLWIDPEPPNLPRGGVAFPIEGNRWLVTAVGMGKDYPPADEAGFRAFLSSLASPILADAVARATPVSDIVTNRSTTNRFRHYETWKPALHGFLATGDGVCAFNPIYGQGMSAAAVSASILARALAEHGPGSAALPRVFFRDQAQFLRGVWRLASGADFAWPSTEGRREPGARLVAPYMRLVLESAHLDLAVYPHVLRVLSLTAPPSRLFSPRMVGRVLWSTLRRRLGARPGRSEKRAPFPLPSESV